MGASDTALCTPTEMCIRDRLGVAIVFGAGQQAVTQFLDKRAGEIIASAP